jgi:putative DNA methylase
MNGDLWYKPKLIEVALPLEDINEACQREKAVPRRGHPATLHLWWARRPLAACRAVLFAQLVDDPSAHPDEFPTEEDQKAERNRLHGIISRLVDWDNIHDEKLLKEAHEEILKSTGGNPPPILDPFAGGGSIPLEAQRLGLETHASDLNPVAVLINKALIEIPPRWAGYSPVFPGAAGEAQSWPAVNGLTEDVLRYGKWMRDEAEKRIGHLYPKAAISGMEVPIIGWIWARTVTCPNPACGGSLPLVRSFWLGKKKGKEQYVNPISDGSKVRFEIRGPGGAPREGTISRSGAMCLLCNSPVLMSYIRSEGQAGRMGAQLMAIVAEGTRQRYYLAPTVEHENAANVPAPHDIPESNISHDRRWFSPPLYGLERYSDLFTNRQLTALTLFSDLVREARDHVVNDAQDSGLDLAEATKYGAAISTYLAFAVSKLADWSSSVCSWTNTAEKAGHTFSRQAIPMAWDFLEIFPLSKTVGNFGTHVEWVAGCLRTVPAKNAAQVFQKEAQGIAIKNYIVATDPPYYDNVGYADLSDFFYVWLRRSLQDQYPDLMGTLLTPKEDELIASQFRHGNALAAERFFESGFKEVFTRICEGTPSGYPITVFYAFKQAENDADGRQMSTGWETLLEGMLQAGWMVTATWRTMQNP